MEDPISLLIISSVICKYKNPSDIQQLILSKNNYNLLNKLINVDIFYKFNINNKIQWIKQNPFEDISEQILIHTKPKTIPLHDQHILAKHLSPEHITGDYFQKYLKYKKKYINLQN